MRYLSYKRQNGETDFQWKQRLCIAKLNKEIDLDWSEIVEILGIDCSSDHLRKVAYGIKESYDNYILETNQDTDRKYSDSIEEKLVEINKERMKLSTEKIEYNKYLRNISRIELWEEKIKDAIKNLDKLEIPEKRPFSFGNKIGVTGFADLHFGKEFKIHGLRKEIVNEYNEEVFKKRMWLLRDEIVSIIAKEDISEVKFFMLGDLLEGILRQSILQNLQYGIIESTMRLSEFLAAWFNDLSKYLSLEVFTCTGNHSEIRPLNSKSFDFPHENMERIIVFYLKARLTGNGNIKIHDAEFINYVSVFGKGILATHGQHDKNLNNSISEYSSLYGVNVDIMLSGHKHHLSNNVTGMSNDENIEYIQFPSIVGSDEFSMKIKKTSPAGSCMLVLEEGSNLRIKYDINLQSA